MIREFRELHELKAIDRRLQTLVAARKALSERLVPFAKNRRDGCVQAGIEYANHGVAFSGSEQESQGE